MKIQHWLFVELLRLCPSQPVYYTCPHEGWQFTALGKRRYTLDLCPAEYSETLGHCTNNLWLVKQDDSEYVGCFHSRSAAYTFVFNAIREDAAFLASLRKGA